MALPEPTKVEADLLKKFRSQVEDVLVSDESKADHFLIRWIRARDCDLEKAETMLRTSLKWREENVVDKVLSLSLDPWLFQNFPFHTNGLDKLGNPVTELGLGSWDMRKATNTNREDEFLTYVNYLFESNLAKIREQNELKGDGEWKGCMWTVLIDWEGYSYAQFLHLKALQNILRMAATYESHYPEVLYKCFFINAPSVFPLLMKLLKSVLAPKTLNKISVFGSNRSEWEPEVLKFIEADQLGVKYGGTKVWND